MSGAEFDWWFDRNPAGSPALGRGHGRPRRRRRCALALPRWCWTARSDGELLRPRDDRRRRARPRHLRRARAKARARGGGAGRRLRARLRERADGAALPRPARLDADRGAARLGAAASRRASLAKPHRVSTSTGDAAATWPNHVVRDAEYLQWRYLDSPRGYEASPTATAYAVVWPAKQHRGRTISRRRRPRRAVGARPRRSGARGRAAVRAAGARAAARVSRRGFLPTPQTLHFMGKALAGRLNPDPSAWRFTLGDTDFF